MQMKNSLKQNYHSFPLGVFILGGYRTHISPVTENVTEPRKCFDLLKHKISGLFYWLTDPVMLMAVAFSLCLT